MSNTFRSIAALAAVGLIAGCSGGGTSPAPITKSNPSTGGPPIASSGKATGSMTVKLVSRKSAKRLPMAGRRPDYISPVTGGIFATFVSNAASPAPLSSSSATLRKRASHAMATAMPTASPTPSAAPTDTPTAAPSATPSPTATPVAATYQGYTLAPNQTATANSPANCGATASDGSFTCTLYFALSPASSPYTISLTAYDSAQFGTTLQPGTALSTDTESETVTANASNTFDFALQGIVGGFNVMPQYVGASQGGSISNATATFTAVDPDFYEIDSVDNATDFAVGTSPTDLNASFAVAALDEGTCGDAAGTTCVTSSSTAVTSPASEAVSYSYDGNGSAGTGASDAPYYGVVTLSEPADYSGFTSSTLGATPYAGTLYVVPLFGLVDPASPYADATSSSTVDFSGAGESISAFTKQFAPPTGATGYTIDHSACGDAGNGAIATFSTAAASTYGQTYTITSGSLAGSCAVNLADGAGDTATITVNNSSTNATIAVPTPGATYAPNKKVRK